MEPSARGPARQLHCSPPDRPPMESLPPLPATKLPHSPATVNQIREEFFRGVVKQAFSQILDRSEIRGKLVRMGSGTNWAYPLLGGVPRRATDCRAKDFRVARGQPHAGLIRFPRRLGLDRRVAVTSLTLGCCSHDSSEKFSADVLPNRPRKSSFRRPYPHRGDLIRIA
jgi:hypothetical protein